MRETISIDPDLDKELSQVKTLTRLSRAAVIRQAIRLGLELVKNRFQQPRPEGYFTKHYATRDAQRVRLENAHAKAIVHKAR